MSNRITLVVIPQFTSKVARFKIKEFNLKIFRWLGIALILLTFYVIFQYIIYLNNSRNIGELKRINDFQELKLFGILHSFNKDRVILEELTNFDKKIRIILNLSNSVENLTINNDIVNKQLLTNQFSNEGLYNSERLIKNINQSFSDTSVNLAFRQQSFMELQGLIIESNNRLLSTPSIKPVRVGYFTSGYGTRVDPFTGALRMHYGIDWAYLPYTAIYATADGVVSKAYFSVSYGNTVIIDHGKGIKTLYAHMANILVKVNQKVKRGQIIGRMGNTGKRSTATHIHYEVHVDNKPVNPVNYILEDLPEVASQFFVEF